MLSAQPMHRIESFATRDGLQSGSISINLYCVYEKAQIEMAFYYCASIFIYLQTWLIGGAIEITKKRKNVISFHLPRTHTHTQVHIHKHNYFELRNIINIRSSSIVSHTVSSPLDKQRCSCFHLHVFRLLES